MRMYGLYRNNNLRANLLSETKEDFDEYLETTTNATVLTVMYEGRHIEGSLQDAVFNSRTYGDEKIFLTRIHEVLEVGDYVLWGKKPYLVTAEDINTSPTHRTFIIRPCNNVINVKVGNKIKPLYVIIDGTIAKFKETDIIAIHNDEFKMTFGANELGNTLKENDKVVIKDKTFRITTLENLTGNFFDHKGTISAYLKRELKSASDEVKEDSEITKEEIKEDSLEDIMDSMFGGVS